MKKYDMIIFDKDGTLVDTSVGIYATNRMTLEEMGCPIPSKERLKGIMGPPLEYCFGVVCNMPEEQVPEAVRRYVRLYKEKGQHMVDNYPGMKETLEVLKSRGYHIGVATLKEHMFVENILTESGLIPYIDAFYGSTHGDGSLETTKAELISRCLTACGVAPGKALMIGDSRYDGEGAAAAGVDFLGVTYGFSIATEKDLEGIPYLGLVDSPLEILDFLGESRPCAAR